MTLRHVIRVPGGRGHLGDSRVSVDESIAQSSLPTFSARTRGYVLEPAVSRSRFSIAHVRNEIEGRPVTNSTSSRTVPM